MDVIQDLDVVKDINIIEKDLEKLNKQYIFVLTIFS